MTRARMHLLTLADRFAVIGGSLGIFAGIAQAMRYIVTDD